MDQAAEAVTDPELAAAEQAYIEKDRKLTAEIHAKSAGFKTKERELAIETEKQAEQPSDQQPIAASSKARTHN
jgi:hypothetical protein